MDKSGKNIKLLKKKIKLGCNYIISWGRENMGTDFENEQIYP
jgi:hypothetical protein